MKRLIAVMLFLSINSHASTSYIGAVTTATAGSGRADIEPTESPALNPAAIALVQGYYFSSSLSSTDNGKGKGQDFVINIADNTKESAVPASLHMVQSRWALDDNPSLQETSRDFQLSVGNFLGKKFALGIGAHFRQDDLEEGKFSQWNGGIGGLWTISKSFGLGFTLEDIFRAGLAAPENYRLSPRTSIGAAYRYQKLVIFKLDVASQSNNSISKPILMGGMEYLTNQWLVLRFGARQDWLTGEQATAAGIGFVGPQFRLNYAFQNVEGAEPERRIRQAIDLVVPIW